MLCRTLFTNATLPYNVHVTHYVLDCSISDHSEPVVAHGVMVDRLFSAQSVKDDVTRDDSQRRFLAQHSLATLLRHCFLKQFKTI